jgi:hypothetical protein
MPAEIIPFPLAHTYTDYWITKKELAERWRVSERWLELRVKHDGLPMRKDPHSRLVRFNLADCERWMEARCG